MKIFAQNCSGAGGLVCSLILLVVPVTAVAEIQATSTTPIINVASSSLESDDPVVEVATSTSEVIPLETLATTSPTDLIVTDTVQLPAGEHQYDIIHVLAGGKLEVGGDPAATTTFKGAKLIAAEIIVDTGGVISADRQGFPRLQGPGAATDFTTPAQHEYYTTFAPTTLGSGGLRSGSFGRGGGAVWLAADRVTIDGEVSASAGTAASGGSVYIEAQQFFGSGELRALGGNFFQTGTLFSPPGNGGHVFVNTDSNSFTGQLSVSGGKFRSNGGAAVRFGLSGTAGLHEATSDTLSITDRWQFRDEDVLYDQAAIVADGQLVFESGAIVRPETLELTNNSTALIPAGTLLQVADLIISDQAGLEYAASAPLQLETLRLEDQGELAATTLQVLEINAENVLIEDGASINATAQGFGKGAGPGSPPEGSLGGGAHEYGDAEEPSTFGSAGDFSGNRGGGAIRLIVSDQLTLDGTVIADGDRNASGGSVWISTKTLQGAGEVSAEGGSFRLSAVTLYNPGAGGRVALYYDDATAWTGQLSAQGGIFSTAGGAPLRRASAGSVVFTTNPCTGTCASSVLFLPGIQASRLYAGEDISVPGILNDVNQGERVWEPGNNNDVRAFRMSSEGETVHNIYTEDILNTANLQTGLFDIDSFDVYAGFSLFMNEISSGEDALIREWYPYAYDWRYDVFDIVANGTRTNADGSMLRLQDVVRELSDRSFSEHVTIVAHSNGGLLAKALVDELRKTGEENLIDRIVFIGTPQLGTPKAIGTVLHGYDQEKGGGFVVEDVLAREIINNLPGAYSLLPSEAYLDQAREAIIRFDQSESSRLLRDAYGGDIANFGTYVDFLKGTNDSLNRTLDTAAAIPATANSDLLNLALERHADSLDVWEAPNNMEVVEVVGVGIATMKSVLYREVVEPICPEDVVELAQCQNTALLKPYAEMTLFGDETVIQASAEAYKGDKQTHYLNFEDLEEAFPDENFSHFNMTEVESIQLLVQRTLAEELISGIDFVSVALPDVQEKYSIEIIDSPVQIVTEDIEGNQTGVVITEGKISIKEEISGSRYFEFGDTKYLVTPQGIDRTTTLTGEALGGYTLTIAELDTTSQEIVHELVNATVTPTMVATYQMTDGEFSTVTTDLDGDGVIDLETTVDGAIVTSEEITYDTLRAAIKDTELRQQDERRLLLLARLAEHFGEKSSKKTLFKRLEKRLLKRLERLLVRHEANGRITTQQLEQMRGIIDSLKND